MPTVTVVLPAHNAEKTLAEAVASVRNQTFRDWELVIVDDASTDGTRNLADTLAEVDSRIRVFHNETNLREAASRNRAVSLASPESLYIAVMDADDRCRPERLEKEVAFLETHPESAFCGASIAIMDESGSVFAERRYPESPREIRKRFCRFNAFAHPTLLFRKSALGENPYRPSRICPDYDLTFRLLEKYDGANLPDILLDYRISSNQIKAKHLKASLADTLRIQSTRLFSPGFFHPLNPFVFLAEAVLLCLPGRLVMRLFTAKYYRKINGRN